MKRITMGIGGAVAALALAVALQGCGGGGSSSIPGAGVASSTVGYFVDAPVAGAGYTTSSGLTGITGSDGSFTYKTGDTVTFTVLGMPLGNAVVIPVNGVVTPVTITGEAPSGSAVTATNAPKAAAIAQFLQTLGEVGSSSSSNASGSIVLPSGTAASNLQQRLATLDAQGGISAVVTGLQTALSNAGITGVTVVPSSTAVTNMNTSIQAASSAAANSQFVNSTWTITANSPATGSATIQLLGNGTVAGMDNSGEVIYGTWIVNAGGSITFHIASAGGGTGTGTVPAATSGSMPTCPTCLAITSGSGTSFTANMTEASPGTQNVDAGIWFGTFTPNSAATANGMHGGSAAMIAESDGSVVGMLIETGSNGGGGGSFGGGNWTPSSGAITVTGTTGGGGGNSPWVVTGNLATETGTLSINGTVMGTVAFARTAPAGVFGGSPVTLTATQFPSCSSSTTVTLPTTGAGTFTTTLSGVPETCDLSVAFSQSGASVIAGGGACSGANNTYGGNGPMTGTWSGCLNGSTLTVSQNYTLGATNAQANMTCTAGSGGLSNCTVSGTVPAPSGSTGYTASPVSGNGSVYSSSGSGYTVGGVVDFTYVQQNFNCTPVFLSIDGVLVETDYVGFSQGNSACTQSGAPPATVNFAFATPVPSGATYSVTQYSQQQTCSATAGAVNSGTMASSNVGNAGFTCQ